MILLKIVNDGTGDSLQGNYDYQVYVNKDLILSGRVENHNRYDGLKTLIKLVSIDIESEDE